MSDRPPMIYEEVPEWARELLATAHVLPLTEQEAAAIVEAEDEQLRTAGLL